LSGDDGAREMVILSVAGGIIVLALAWFGRSEDGAVQSTDRLIVGSALLASFILGISLAAKPGWVRRLRKDAVHAVDSDTGLASGQGRRGHHPDCEHFRPHTVNAIGKVLCAGCTGLGIGSVASIAMVILYVSLPISPSPMISMSLVAIGIALVAASMADSELFQARGGERLFSNLIMPFGFFLVAVGLLESTENAAYGLMGVLISFLWLDTRIRLSRRRHIRMCSGCVEACKSYLA